MGRRAVVAGLLLGLSLALLTPGAGAHALVTASDPPDGALLDRSPSRVLITFTETPDPALSTVKVLDSTGRPVSAGAGQPAGPNQLAVPLPALAGGVYTVSWRTVSQVDGHVTGGSFAFGIGVSPAAAPPAVAGTGLPATPSPSALSIAGRWALYWGMALLVGAAAVELVVFPKRDLPQRWALVAAWAVGAAGLVCSLLAQRSAAGVPLGSLLSSAAGAGLVREGTALGAAGVTVALAAARKRPGRLWVGLVGLGGAATMLAHAIAGHAGAAGSTRWFNIAVQWLHLLAVGAWIGGLAWLLIGLAGTPEDQRPGVVRRFSRLAGVALAGVALSGALRAVDDLGSWHRLFTTSFGHALLVKGALFLPLVGLGVLNHYWVVPGVTKGRRRLSTLRRSVAGEITFGAAIFAVTGLLSGLAPSALVAASAPRAPETPRVAAVGNDFAQSVRVRLVVEPGSLGPNRFEASVTDFDTGANLAARRVALRFALPPRPDVGSSTLELSQGPDGRWRGQGTELSVEGTWRVVTVAEAGSTSVEVPLDLPVRPPPEKITVDRSPGQPTLYTIALPGARSAQTFVDPASPGHNTVHVTFFDAGGGELAISSASLEAAPVGPDLSLGSSQDVVTRRLSPGHFVADADLALGSWRFTFEGAASDGSALHGYFDEQVSPR